MITYDPQDEAELQAYADSLKRWRRKQAQFTAAVESIQQWPQSIPNLLCYEQHMETLRQRILTADREEL